MTEQQKPNLDPAKPLLAEVIDRREKLILLGQMRVEEMAGRAFFRQAKQELASLMAFKERNKKKAKGGKR